MSMQSNEILAQELMEMKSIPVKILGKRISKFNKRYCFSIGDYHKSKRIEGSLKRLFSKSIDKDTSKRLKILNELIAAIEMQVYHDTGWRIGEGGAIKEDNFVNTNDYEFATHDTFRLVRDSEGFHVYTTSTFNQYYDYLRFVETDFYERNKVLLAQLHDLFNERQAIMTGKYIVTNPDMTYETMKNIASYLGYSR